MTRPFVCATDFSDAATAAADAAVVLAARSGAPLRLVHVFDPPAVSEELLLAPLRAAAREGLRAEAERLRRGGAEVEEELLEGSAYRSIADFAERSSARLVVMASHRKRTLPARWFFGSVAERVVRAASVPCLVLRDPSFVEEWLSGGRPLRVFVAADLASSLDAPLLWVKGLAEIGPCEITVAHLNWVPGEASRRGAANAPAPGAGSPIQFQDLLETELRSRVARLLGDLSATVRVRPCWGRTDWPLVDLAEDAETDLLVVGTRAKGIFSRLFDESVSTGVLRHAPMAVATVPLEAARAEPAPPPSFDRVLVATDLSDAGNDAIAYACALASPGGTLCLVHVAEPLGPGEAEAQRQLAALVPPLAGDRGLRCETVVRQGRSAAKEIVDLAERFEADAICLGSRGRSGVARALLGSVAQAVLSESRRPVLVVRRTD